MKTTKTLISIIADYMPEVPAPKVLEYLSRAYLELANSNSSQLVFYTENEEPYPILNTVDGTRKYVLDNTSSLDNLVDVDGNPITLTQLGVDVTARKLRKLFVEGWVSGAKPYTPIGCPNQDWVNQKQFYEIPCQSYNQRGGTPATVILFDDYDTDVFVEFYYTPSDLLTANDIMLIDTDQWTDALIDGAVGYYEDQVNGRSERLQNFQGHWKRAFLSNGLDNLTDRIPNTFQARPIG